MGVGFVIKGEDGFWLHSGYKYIPAGPKNSNNVAEYLSLAYGLKWLLENGYSEDEITAIGDSQLVINQMAGLWQVNGGLYSGAKQSADGYAKQFSNLSYKWVRREFNTDADAHSKQALEENGIFATNWKKKKA